MRLPLPFSRLNLSLWILAAPYLTAGPEVDAVELFRTRVQPVLAARCFACHTTQRAGGLDMGSRELLLKGGNSGPAIVPGHPERSLLIQSVQHTHERLKMPLSGSKLEEQEISDLISWVRAGAVWLSGSADTTQEGASYFITEDQRAFWSFQPVTRPDLPEVQDESWPRGPIDHFILSRMEGQGLGPVPAADRRTLIRRASFDLIGLPPTPEEVDAFLADPSPDAFGTVVDRLLASPRYGERWGRHWLDVARYADDQTVTRPASHAFRYRDWVIGAFNDDLPYDLFVKAQIAGDLLPDADNRWVAATGLYTLSPDFGKDPTGTRRLGCQETSHQDDRVDVTTRAFLGLTGGCARCHDHKFDPIPTLDYYALLGVFTSSECVEFPLASHEAVTAYQEHKKGIDDQEDGIEQFIETQAAQLAEILATQTTRYMVASWKVLGPPGRDLGELAREEGLDRETLQRWVQYLGIPARDHPYLEDWKAGLAPGAGESEIRRLAQGFQDRVLSVIKEKKTVDEKNRIALGSALLLEKGSDKTLLGTNATQVLARDRFFLWRDMVFKGGLYDWKGILYYGDEVERFLSGQWKLHLDSMKARLQNLKDASPPKYPIALALRDSSHPANERIHVRGNPDALGQEAPRRFLSVLSPREGKPFRRGSGRLELAKAIANPENPLTARVMVNRIWQHHFGRGIVATASNFGHLGDPPSHPRLLDYLASRFLENNWSIKALHREILLSSTYALSGQYSERNFAVDPENRLLWRANRRRLDVEALRDSILLVSGGLDLRMGGEAAPLTDPDNRRRTVYGFVSRQELDHTLSSFDFPDPNETSAGRMETNTPLQQLFFLNSNFILTQAQAFASRLAREASDDGSRIRQAYRRLFGRDPSQEESHLDLEFLRGTGSNWNQYAQVLLSSNEFIYVE